MDSAAAPGTSPADQDELTLSSLLPSWLDGEGEFQQTLGSSIGCVGVGLHSGRTVHLNLHPGEPNTGVVFIRSDIPDAAPVRARHGNVIDTRLCTVIGAGEARIATIEHLMAAFVGAGIDNARVTLDGAELPILDGSAAEFLFLISCAGVAQQAALRRVVEITAPVRVQQGESWAELLPHRVPGTPGLHLQLGIDFDCAAIGRQSFAMHLNGPGFARELSAARTFVQAAEIDGLRRKGLALGGSLENAVVVDSDRVLNPGGLRQEREFVRHKMLDVVGDLALAGHGLRGRFRGFRTGHALNSALLQALFSNGEAWRMAGARASGWRSAA